MRLRRLALGRYGHLSDAVLEFPADRDLHVVLGANEAGKSTALAAIGDALFGFPHRTEFAFLHDARELRVGFSVCARDGRATDFVRLKRRKDDLLDAGDNPAPESALAAFLGGTGRERFEHVFGLDAAELRRGGKAILEDKGEVGESILQAHTGISGFRELAKQLGDGAAQLFGDRRGRRDFHVAADAFKAARQSLESRSVEPADYKEQREAQLRLTEGRAANAREAEALHAERTRLERIRRTAPALRARAVAIAEREAMGHVPSLPADAEARRQAATLAREQAAHDVRRERARDEELGRELAGLVVDAAVLAEAAAIDALAADRNRIAAARRDREEQRVVAAQRQRAVQEAGQRLGLAGDATALAARVPDALARSAVKRATEAHERLAARAQKAGEDAEADARALAAAEAALTAAPAAEPFAALRAAADAVRAEGRLDDEMRQSAATLAAAAEAAAHGLAALPLWSGSAAALAAAPVPLEAAVAEGAKALQAAEDTLRAHRDRRVAIDAVLAGIDADLRGVTAAGEVPTTEAIADARGRRDRAWRLIRRRLDGGAAPGDAELAGLGAAADLPDALEELTRAADALADRRAADRERVVAFDQLRARKAQQEALRDTVLAAEAVAQTVCDAAQAAWRTIWQPVGVLAQEPAAMREWLRQRAAVLVLAAQEHDARRKLEALTARHAAAFSALAALLPEAAEQAQGRLAEVLRTATLICAERERAEAARTKLQTQAEQARAALDEATQAAAKLAAEQAAWREGWSPVAASVGLAGGASAEDGKLALELWSTIESRCGEWREAEDRVAQMTRAIEGFEAEAAAVWGRCSPVIARSSPGMTAEGAVRDLAQLLAEARATDAERARKLKERDGVQKALGKAATAFEAAEQTLAGLRRLAGAEDDAALQAAIARATAHADLSQKIAERDEELARENRSPAELEADAVGVEPDALPARLAEIEERLRAIGEENAAYAGKLTELRAALDGMEHGRDAAGAAQDMQNALAEMEDVAARYVRLRLAHTLLRAGIDRFRRQQQGPLLGRAGALFARLTEGRYDRLTVGETESGVLFIVALRPDGTECPAEKLSDGTRDQLYLALRLAAIESYAVRAEPLPFVADDLLVNFDDRRARAALRVLAEFGAVTQTILFTHHAHIAEMAEPAWASLHRLPAEGLLAA